MLVCDLKCKKVGTLTGKIQVILEVPLKLRWMLMQGVIVENVEWPTPVNIPYPPLMTFGYEGDVVFPFKVFRALILTSLLLV